MLPELFITFDQIMAILPITQFSRTIEKLFQNEDEFVAMRAISTLEERIISHQNDPEYCYELVPLVESLVQLLCSNDSAPAIIISTFSCCGELARVLDNSYREDLIKFVPFVIGQNGLLHAEKEVVSSALMTLNYYLRSLGPRIIPFFPQFMPPIINLLEKELNSPVQDHLKLTYAYLTISVISEVLPQFMSSYAPSVIKIAINPNLGLYTLHSKKCAETLQNCLDTMSENIAPRYLLPTIFSSIEDLFSAGKSSMKIILAFLAKILKNISKSDILEFRSEVSKFFLEAFDLRTKISDSISDSDILDLENDLIISFYNLVLKLNDEHFKPIYLKLVDWATLSISFDNLTEKNIVKRQITFYHIVNEMFNRLKVSIFLF
jgi:U3 small nucleolar RNA-associated protein 10